MTEKIGMAQFLDKGVVHCITKDGKPMRPLLEVNVRSFIETKLKKRQIDERTVIFANGQKKTVKEFKKELGMDTVWYRIRKKFFS